MRGRPRIHPHSSNERRWTCDNGQIVWALKDTYPQVQSGRFVHAMRAAFPRALDEVTFARVPDAFAIYPETGEVDIFEVEVTHAVPRSLMLDIGRLWIDLGCYGVDLHLYIVSRYGHVNELEIWPNYAPLLWEFLNVPVADSGGDGRPDGPDSAGGTKGVA